MSETTQTPQAEYVPQNVLSAEENEDATQPLQQPTEAATEASEDKPEHDEAEARLARQQRREAQRIAYKTKQYYAEKARADAAEARLREYDQRLRQLENPGAPQPQPTQQDIEAWVDQRAEQKLAQRQDQQRFSDWDAKGIEEFGTEKFRNACKVIAEMASDEQRPILRAVAMDTDGGQKAIMELA